MKIIYGTANQGKLNQVREFTQDQGVDVEILSIRDIGFYGEIEETGTTFEENSLIKARAIRKFCDKQGIKEIVMTDDAGLCIDALGGKPGVYSARYAGDHAPQEVAIGKIFEELKDIPEEKRTAQFVCVLTAILSDGTTLVARGETRGKIATKAGQMGKLTYGPIFIPEGFDRCLNELTEEELGSTHREKALLEMIQKIKNIK